MLHPGAPPSSSDGYAEPCGPVPNYELNAPASQSRFCYRHLGCDVCTWGSVGGGDAPGGAHLGL